MPKAVLKPGRKSPEPVTPERSTRAQVEAERYPGVEKYPALRRALVLHRALENGKSREEAERIADEKVGPRAPRAARLANPIKRSKRPEPEMRHRVKPTARKAGKK